MKIAARHYRTGKPAVFDLPKSFRPSPRKLLYFGPAWLDLQCNGYAGIDYNRPEITPEQVAESVLAMLPSGCAAVLPTVITAAPERIEHSLRQIVAARALDRRVRDAIVGIHLEGPFISPEDGARGAHPLEHVRPVNERLWQRFQRAAEGSIRIVTLAPEVRGALPFIEQLREENVVPAIGHTMASLETIVTATHFGAMMSTHLGNGCPQHLHRHQNPVLAQLGEDRLDASFIADGIHLPPHVLRAFFRAKGVARTVLVTDAMAAAGAPAGTYTIGDLVVEVGDDRVVRQPGSPNFAGSALTMAEAVANAIGHGGMTLAEAWDAASTHPAKLLAPARTALPTMIVECPGGITPIAILRGKKLLWHRESPGSH